MTIAIDSGRFLTTPDRRRVRLLGMEVDALDRAEVGRRMDDMVRAGGAHRAVTVNLDFLHQGTRDSAFRDLVNDADLVVPDGTPVLWFARYLGGRLPERITGPDLIDLSVSHSQRHGSSVFFLGAGPGVAERAAERLRSERGPFAFAGAYAPPFGGLDAAEDRRICRLVRDAQPDFLFVAFGCPKQDYWIRDHAHLEVPFSAGIGGSFEFLSGAIRRAPQWAQRSGLEWSFRLWHEPRRLARRYLVDDVRVVARLIASRFRSAHEAAPSGDGG